MRLDGPGPGIAGHRPGHERGLEHRARRGAQPGLRGGHGPAQHEKILRRVCHPVHRGGGHHHRHDGGPCNARAVTAKGRSCDGTAHSFTRSRWTGTSARAASTASSAAPPRPSGCGRARPRSSPSAASTAPSASASAPTTPRRAASDPLDVLDDYEYTIALPPPSFYAQFNNLEDPDHGAGGLLELGFDEVFEVARAAELVSEATRRLLQERPGAPAGHQLGLPGGGAADPGAVSRPDRPCAAAGPRWSWPPAWPRPRPCEKTGLAPEKIGCIFLSPCPAKVRPVRAPWAAAKRGGRGGGREGGLPPLLGAEKSGPRGRARQPPGASAWAGARAAARAAAW